MFVIETRQFWNQKCAKLVAPIVRKGWSDPVWRQRARLPARPFWFTRPAKPARSHIRV